LSDYLLSVLLGIVEGLTEFLPVSSTAHLRISEALLGIDLSSGYWKMYSIVIQLGAILCLLIYFRSRLKTFLSTFPSGRDGSRSFWNHPLTLTAVAFVCTAVPSFLLSKLIGKNLESLHVMAIALIVGGIVMWAVDARYGDSRAGDTSARASSDAARSGSTTSAAAKSQLAGDRTTRMEDMSLGQAIWIGLSQNFSAIFPGTSRSMATITAGQVVGMSRPAALEFSFFLSIPTMFAATGYEFFKSFQHKAGASAIGAAPSNLHEWLVLGIGFVVSFLVAYLVVAWFMNWVRHHGFAPFAIYRIIVGVAVLVWAMRAGLR
jgi:undecaprenyl-diphosphatase